LIFASIDVVRQYIFWIPSTLLQIEGGYWQLTNFLASSNIFARHNDLTVERTIFFHNFL